jgi:hypothetical protein
MKALSKIAEYFTGTETLNYYAGLRKFYSENIKDKNILEKKLDKICLDEMKYVLIGKIIPNFIDIGSVLWADYVKCPLPLIFAGAAEGLRVSMIEEFEFKKFEHECDKNELLLNELSKPENQKNEINHF